jgi:hypothetical protein
MNKVEKALNYMVMLIENGWEFPDAEWKALDRFKTVSQYDLQEAYDQQYEAV